VSMTTYLMLRDADRLRAVLAWTLGNLSLASWTDIGRASPYAAIGMGLLYALGGAWTRSNSVRTRPGRWARTHGPYASAS